MTSLVRTTTRTATIVLLVAALAACGSSSKSASTTAAKSTTTAAKTTSTPDSSGTTDATGTTPTSSASTEITTPSTVVVTGGGTFCKTVADSYNSGLSQAAGATSTPAGLKKVLQESRKKSDAALASAPGEIKPDLQTLLGASNKLLDALAKVDYNIAKLPPRASAALSTPAVTAAGTRVTAFVKKRCGIDLGGSSSGAGSSPGTTTP